MMAPRSRDEIDEARRSMARVIDSKGLRVSEVIEADSLRLIPQAGRVVMRFEGVVVLSAAEAAALVGATGARP